MCSSAKQPNKHIITLSRRPPTLKTRLPYKREHVFTATQDVDISPARRPSFRWHRPSFRVTWPWEGSRGGPTGPRMAARTARQAHTAPTNHQKRYQIPRRRPLQVQTCHTRYCGKVNSSAKQPNKHIITLSRRPPAVKTRYKREHVFQVTPNSSTHHQRGLSTYPRVVGPAAHFGSDGPRMAAGGDRQAHTAPTNRKKGTRFHDAGHCKCKIATYLSLIHI